MNKVRFTTMCIVHAGFRGLRAFIARKKSWCNLIIFHIVIPHDTIHKPVGKHYEKPTKYHRSNFNGWMYHTQ